MIPQLIASGFGAICCIFDVWGISQMVHGILTTGRQYASESQIPIVKGTEQAKEQVNGKTNGQANGHVNGTALES
jgi:hypothetical protein